MLEVISLEDAEGTRACEVEKGRKGHSRQMVQHWQRCRGMKRACVLKIREKLKVEAAGCEHVC